MKSSTWSWRSWFREAHTVCSRLYQRDVERSHVTRIILRAVSPVSVVAEETPGTVAGTRHRLRVAVARGTGDSVWTHIQIT